MSSSLSSYLHSVSIGKHLLLIQSACSIHLSDYCTSNYRQIFSDPCTPPIIGHSLYLTIGVCRIPDFDKLILIVITQYF